MKYERYELMMKAVDGSDYTFLSKGPNGEIELAVRFKSARKSNSVLLSFGNLLPNGEIDDMIRNGNLDRNKILATVADAVNRYTSVYPNKEVSFFGSTASRSRLYRMAISANWDELKNTYLIFGIEFINQKFCYKDFKKNRPFMGFAVKRISVDLYL